MKAKPGPSMASRRAQQVTAGFTENQRAYSDEDWERFLEKLKQGLCQEPSTANPTTPDHSQIQDVLPFYIFEEQLGCDVQRVYPLVWKHLCTCRDCKNLYVILAAKDTPTASTRTRSKKRGKSVRVKPAAPLAAWNKAEHAEKGIYAFTFSPDYIGALRAPAAAKPTMRSARTESDILLLDDSIRHTQDLIHLTAWLEPSGVNGNTDQIRLQVTPPHAANVLQATLRWNGKAYTPTRANKNLVFENLESPRVNNSLPEASPPFGDFALEIKISNKKRTR